MPWLRMEFQLCTACAHALAMRQPITVRATGQPEAVRCAHVVAPSCTPVRRPLGAPPEEV